MYTGNIPEHKHDIGKSTIFQLKKTSSFIVDFPFVMFVFWGAKFGFVIFLMLGKKVKLNYS